MIDSLDRELDSPAHHDPGIEQLRRIENSPAQWVEENLELFELNCLKAKKYRLPGQERFEGKENEERRTVRIMHPSAVMRCLRLAGVDARNDEHPNARLWLNDWTRAGLVGVNAWVAPQEYSEQGYLMELASATSQATRDLITQNFYACREGRKVQRTITSLQEPCGPEWSVMHFNDHGIAAREKYRGWRTAMLVLIVAGILTEEEVDRAFGPAMGEAGAWYREQLQSWRQLKIGKAI